ncbi:uncharacterized protein LOC132705226 isoform X2 [Cylas formicarius]|nr:uncharacterized protein LOC132705226 isoform X2 [Cylas formicarius]
MKTSLDTEHQKSMKEWREKVVVKQKEVNILKSDLEFKNLTIANLKEQLSNLKRHCNLEMTQTFTQSVAVPREKPQCSEKYLSKNKGQEDTVKNEVILEAMYPIKVEHLEQIFQDFSKEKHIRTSDMAKLSQNTLWYSQNQLLYKEWNFEHKCVSFKTKALELNHFYSDLVKLTNTSSDQLNNNESDEAVDKVLCITLILLQDLEDYLIQLGLTLKGEDIHQIDTNYLKDKTSSTVGQFSTQDYHKDQAGIKCGKMLFFLSEILPFNNHLANCVSQQKRLKCQDSTEYSAPISNKYKRDSFPLLNVILNIIKIIGKYRKADVMKGFLCSVTNLLRSICKSGNFEVVQDLCCQIFAEIVFSRPGVEVVYSLTFWIKMSSKFPHFIKFLFLKNDKTPLRRDTKGVLDFTEGACPFCVFNILFQNTILQLENIPVNVCSNIMTFTYNILNYTGLWTDQSVNVCACLSQHYKIQIEVIYIIIDKYVKGLKEKQRVNGEYDKLLKHGLIEKMLNLMAFNNYELTEKYVDIYAQFKETQRVLGIGQSEDPKLNPTEEILHIPETKFVDVDF